MSEPKPAPMDLVTDPGEVAEIAAALRIAGAFAFDLEFASDARAIPELALLQIGWGSADDPEVRAIDPLAVDLGPLLACIESPELVKIAHSARQDLWILFERFGLRAHNLFDTQIAAAFVGRGEQIGYGKLVEAALGVKLDKGAQFTRWLERPLSPRQLRYALDDVRYLPAVARLLGDELDARGRRGYVLDESEALAVLCAERVAPELLYLELRGAKSLGGKGLGALRALTAWRDGEARLRNKPLSWILPDKAMLEICRKGARSERELKSIRGIGEGTVKRYADEIIAKVNEGASQLEGLVDVDAAAQPSQRQQVWASVILGIVQAAAEETEIAARFIATKSDVDTIAQILDECDGTCEPDLPIFQGWRRDVVGGRIAAWLRGEAAIVCDPASPTGIRLGAS